MRHTPEEILRILDAGCEAFTFPMLDNGYVYLAATRLSLFRSDEDWAMVIEVFGYSPRAGLPDICITTFASQIKDRKVPKDFVTPDAHRAYLTKNPHNESRFISPIEDGPWIDAENPELVAETAEGLRLRGRFVPLPGLQSVEVAGVKLQEAPRVHVFELCRVLAEMYRDDVLATPAERRGNVPDALSHVLALEEWHHPDVVLDTERPSRSRTFQQLAQVLVSGEASAYRPIDPPNTHWINWPEGGTL